MWLFLCLRRTSEFWGINLICSFAVWVCAVCVSSQTPSTVCCLLSRGLLGAHVMADLLRERGERMQWYRDELLHMATELGHRLLPAFNTTSGLPYPKVFLVSFPLAKHQAVHSAPSYCASFNSSNQTSQNWKSLSDETWKVEFAPRGWNLSWRGSLIIGFVVFVAGESALRSPEPPVTRRRPLRHLHSVCRNHDPGVCCSQQTFRRVCLWGISLFSIPQ